MKKVFCFSLIVMILALASSPLLVKADDVVVSGSYEDTPALTNNQTLDLRNATLLLEYLRNGGTIDLNNVDTSYDSKDIINDFGSFVEDVLGVGKDVLNFVNPFQTDIQYHGLQPIRPSERGIFNFLGLLPFYALSDESEPTPTPPPDYSEKVNTIISDKIGVYNVGYVSINPSNLWWQYNGPSGSNVPVTTLNSFSVYNRDTNFNELNSYINWLFFSYGIADIHFDTETGLMSVSNFNIADNLTYNDRGNILYGGAYSSIAYNNNTGKWYSRVNQYLGSYTSYQDFLPTNHFNSVSAFIDYCYMHFRHVNIYVDNEPWALVGDDTINYNINISTNTVIPTGESGRVSWMYDWEIFFRIDRIWDILDDLLYEIRNTPNTPTVITWKDFENVIYDVDGNQVVGVKIFTPDTNIDEDYLSTYGPIIPAFIPLFTPVINDTDIYNLASTAVSPIPEDLFEVFGYMFMGVLFIGFIHRLLE